MDMITSNLALPVRKTKVRPVPQQLPACNPLCRLGVAPGLVALQAPGLAALHTKSRLGTFVQQFFSSAAQLAELAMPAGPRSVHS